MTDTTERPKRTLRQPTKGTLRETLARAADTIAAKNAEIDRLATLLDSAADKTEKALWLGFIGGAVISALLAWAVRA